MGRTRARPKTSGTTPRCRSTSSAPSRRSGGSTNVRDTRRRARFLRDARWDAPGAGPVPLLQRTAAASWRFRRHRTPSVTPRRWHPHAGCRRWQAAATAGGPVARRPRRGRAWTRAGRPSQRPAAVADGDRHAGGALGAAGIGGGLAFAEVLARLARAVALAAGGALGGLIAGAHRASDRPRDARRRLRSRRPGTRRRARRSRARRRAGLGYAAATRHLVEGGMAAPRGRARTRAALITGVVTAVAGIVLTVGGRRMVATSLDLIAGSCLRAPGRPCAAGRSARRG